ncbi:hypothetical protein [Leuconostoc falkenbergense]|uniref:hypothetical protein n=1 Tax=Leuconostoc falkenbergense TaxID=2766470 RepID=UPI0021AA5188|nr:hypothetical protein [Leuconostoc falkenbergense]MCT4390383.1 hypothetical protein [Leuconostoc falkenbergense]
MEEKKPWYKQPIIIMAITLIVLVGIIEISMNIASDGTNRTSTTSKSSSSIDDTDYSDDESTSSSEESESNSSSSNDFGTDTKTSLANLKADISTMPKENYDNIENSTLEKMDFDPTGANPSASSQISAAMNSLKNIQKLADDAKELANKPDSDYTQNDKTKLTNYSNVLNEYLLAFKDYATVTYQDKYTSEDPSTSQSDKQLLIDEMNTARSNWTDKKNQWLNQYNEIINQQ